MTFKIDHTSQTVNASDGLLCCFDVSKASLSLYVQYQRGEQPGAKPCQIEEQLPNQTGAIERLLGRLAGLVEEVGSDGLRVLAGPTGGYERKLVETVRRLGHETGLISPEHAAKLKTV